MKCSTFGLVFLPFPLCFTILCLGTVKRETGAYETFQDLFKQILIQTGQHQTEVVRGAPPTGARGKTYVEKVQKQRKEINWL